ncbi:MAG TPA: FCD domain-containing protein, partial [Bryobacteraceae bacterium]|nr:FCD domain-containing protein [Bryobacteraceae bacterium]
REFTMGDIWDAIEMRGVLEGTAARLGAERLTDNRELATLRRYRDEMDAMMRPTIDSFARYLDLNEAFHTALVELAKSPVLRRTLERVTALPFASPSALVFARTKLPHAQEMFTLGQEQHRAIVEAIENRQGTRAESVAREHAQLSRRNLEAALQDTAVWSGLPGASLIKLPSAV